MPVICVQVFDEIDPVVLETVCVKAIETLDHVRTMMASVVDDEIERSKLLDDLHEKSAIGLTAYSDMNATGGRVMNCAGGIDIDADHAGIRMLEIVLPQS